MPRKKKPPKKTEFDIVHMTEGQCNEVRSDIESMEKMLDDPRPWVRDKITDVGEVKGQIASKKKLLADHSPRRMRGEKANKAYAEAKKLAAFIQGEMPTNKQYFQRYAKDSDGHTRQAGFEKAVQQQVAFQTNPELQRAVVRYKNIMRRIDSDDPTLTNIEALRK
jgi:hypothetical protein